MTAIVTRDSDRGKELIARAHRRADAADRAFTRWFEREVTTSSAATRLRAQADEAWADVRLYVEDGDRIEWEGYR